VAIGLTVIATTVGSLTQKSAWALPIASIDRAPPSAIDTAMAIARALSIDTAAVSHWRAKDSCNDFVFSFLNSTCSKIRARHVERVTHRVATLLIGHPAPTPSSVTAQMPSVTASGQEVAGMAKPKICHLQRVGLQPCK